MKSLKKLPKRELYVVDTMLGEFYDVTVRTNGGATFYVTDENIFAGNRNHWMFRSREKAIAWAKKRYINLNGE